MIWYNVGRHYTSAGSPSDHREDIFLGEPCACPAGKHVRRTWYNIVRYYTSADLRPTRGRTISLANHAHPPEGEGINALSMSGEHSIMSSDIIPASVRRPTCGRKFHSKLYASPKGNMDEGNCRGMEGDIKTRGRIISHGGE